MKDWNIWVNLDYGAKHTLEELNILTWSFGWHVRRGKNVKEKDYRNLEKDELFHSPTLFADQALFSGHP